MMRIKDKVNVKRADIVLLIGIVAISANLRPAITSVGPLIGFIRDDMHLSNGLAGLLTTLPLVAFAVFSPLAPKFSRRLGIEMTLFLGLMTLVAGIMLRSTPSMSTLYTGTFTIGTAIAVSNVLLPSLIKQKFSDRVGLMTGVYTTFMGGFAALGSGVSVPLASHLGFGWRSALGFWAVLAAFAALVWLPQLRHQNRSGTSQRIDVKLGGLWRSPLAWQVTCFMGLQSSIFYVTVTWIPNLLHDSGMDPSTSGWMVSYMQLIGLPATFIVSVLADRRPNQKRIVFAISSLYIVAFAGLLSLKTAWVYVWITLLGIGQSSTISLALAFLALRARNAQQAAELSGMAQSVGYLLAAVGPVAIGYLYDLTQTWSVPLTVLMFVSFCMLFAGLGAGRNAYVTPDKNM
ncbi:CynX/NimT family MFS transporter [Novibacillus thermophilus]|jgi:CP family cyanate transporter-like MFS transporter